MFVYLVLEEIKLKEFKKKGIDLEDYFLSFTNKVSRK